MADLKISALTALAGSNVEQAADVLAIVDTSVTTTKKILVSELSQAMLVLGTPQASTSGTSIDFTGIPAWVKTITVMFVGVSTNGTSPLIIQIGPAAGPETTAYACASSNNGTGVANFTTGFGLNVASAAAVMHGSIVLSLQNASSFNWVASGNIAQSNAVVMLSTAGAKTLAAVLTQVRITTVNGTDAFDAGAININYE